MNEDKIYGEVRRQGGLEAKRAELATLDQAIADKSAP